MVSVVQVVEVVEVVSGFVVGGPLPLIVILH